MGSRYNNRSNRAKRRREERRARREQIKQDPAAHQPRKESSEAQQRQRGGDTPQSSILPLNQPSQPMAEILETVAPETKADEVEKRSVPWTGIQTISQIFLGMATVAVLIYHGIVFSGQQRAMEAGLKKTDEQLAIANRAVDEAEKARIDAQTAMVMGTQPYIQVSGGGSTFNPGEPASAELTILNEGNTPSRINGVVKFVFTKGEIPKADYSGAVPIKEITVLPHRSEVIWVTSRILVTREQWEGVGGQDKKMRLFVYGRVFYTGIGGPYAPKEFFYCYPSGSVGARLEEDCYERYSGGKVN